VRWLLRALAIVVGLLVLAIAVLLAIAHRQVRSIDPPLPRVEDLRAFAASDDLPVRVSFWNTASQPTPRSAVLDPSRDPDPAQPYVMSHPSFVIEWADGKALLVDAGMDPEQARSFGRTIEWIGGGPIEPHGSIAEHVLAAFGERPLALAFTHLHTDHVGGVVGMCRTRATPRSVRLLQTAAQADLANHTTRPARALLETAPCLASESVEGAASAPIDGLPGAFVIHAGGHTPGSQIVGVFVRDAAGPRGILFAGDAANAIDGIRHDVPKPWAYRTFLVPEWEDRLRRVRAWLRDAERAGFVVAIAHDERHLATTGIPRFGE